MPNKSNKKRKNSRSRKGPGQKPDWRRQLQLAKKALEQGKPERANDLLSNVLQRRPDDFFALILSAKSLADLAEPRKCQTVLDHLVAIHGDRDESWLIAAEMSETLGDLDAAASYLSRGIGKTDSSADARIKFARILERLHRLDAAEEIIQQVIARNPNHPEALLAKSTVLRRKKAVSECGEILESLFSNEQSPPPVRISAGYSLARLLDEQGEYDLAMQVLESAKQSQLATAGQLVKLSDIDVSKNMDMAQRIEVDHVVLDGQQAPLHPPVALLGGFPRSGTTLLESSISQHPLLVSAEETPVFSQTVIRPASQEYGAFGGPIEILSRINSKDVSRFQSSYFERAEQFIRDEIGNRILVDKNPVLTVAVPFFKKIFNRSKLIIALRDPRDVIVSCFMLPLPQLNRFNVKFLSIAGTSRQYVTYMNAWCAYRKLLDGDFCEVRYEDTVHDFEQQIRRVLSYLGLEWNSQVLDFQQRAQRRPANSPTYVEVTRPVSNSRVGRWKNYARYLAPITEELQPFLDEFNYN